MKSIRLFAGFAVVLFGTLVGSGVAGAITGSAPVPYSCSGGNIPAGVYGSMTITGSCFMPAGAITVHGDLIVAAGALLDATSPGDPAATPLLPADLSVTGDVKVGAGAVLLVGCSPFIFCPSAVTDDHIHGNVTATESLAVLLHSVAVGGNVSMLGGGNGANCTSNPPVWLTDPSLANGEGPGTPLPVYSDFEDVTIGGNFSVYGLQTCWMGALRDQVGGDANFSGNTMGDPDAMEIDSDVVTGNMSCLSNLPAVQFGDSGAAPNLVGQTASGECGFGVVLRNPAPGAGEGKGVPEHITVPTSSLGTYTGTLVLSSPESEILGTTSSGLTVSEAKADAVLNGTGLTGSFIAKKLENTTANGSSKFYLLVAGKLSFAGATGHTEALFVGSTTTKGYTSGTFQIMVGGRTSGALGTLAGWGYFSSAGEPSGTVYLIEHLAIT
jgi:hypothetical protein